MHLIEAYSSSCRLKIDHPFILERFYPLNSEKFITIQSQGAMGAKQYFYWQETIDLLLPIFKKYNIEIIQLGSKDEQPLNNVINLLGKTNLGQTYYIIKKALLHAGTDSSLIHFASSLNKKIVGLYSVSSPKLCGPFWGDFKNHICLEPEFKKGTTYSFNPNESPSPINTIKPEKVANSILELLGLTEKVSIESFYFGKDYKSGLIELIPDHIVHPSNFQGSILNIRADLLWNENGIYGNLPHHPCVIVTKNPLDINILKQFKQNVKNILYLLLIENKERDLEFVKKLHESGLPYVLLTHDLENINTFKFDYLDFNQVLHCPVNKKEDIKNQDKINENTLFKTNKLILSEGKIYQSRAHWEAKQVYDPHQPNKIIDNESFYRDVEYFYLYNNLV